MYSAFVVGFGVLLLVCQDIQAQDVLCNRGDNYVDVVLNAGDEFTYDTKNNRKNKYKKNQYCLASYELGESCSGASISCPTFALRGNRRCTRGDIMEIFSDSTDQSFCRDSGPMDYQPDGDFLMRFTSNQRGSAEGFKCTVKCIDGGSGSTTQSTAAPTGNTGSTPTASTTASTATSPTTPTTVTTPTTPTTVTTPTTTTTETAPTTTRAPTTGSIDCSTGCEYQIKINQTWSQEPNGYDRTAEVKVPATSTKLPVVIDLHGSGGKANVNRMGSFLRNSIIVAASGYENQWNILKERTKAPDVAFIEELINQVAEIQQADMDDVTVTGTSNGAALIARLLIEIKNPRHFKRVIPMVSHMIQEQYHDGSFWMPSNDDNGAVNTFDQAVVPDSPGPEVIYFHGTADGAIPYEGGQSLGMTLIGAQATTYAYAKAFGYTGAQIADSAGVEVVSGVTKYEYNGASRVVHYKLQDVKHNAFDPLYREFVQGLIKDTIEGGSTVGPTGGSTSGTTTAGPTQSTVASTAGPTAASTSPPSTGSIDCSAGCDYQIKVNQTWSQEPNGYNRTADVFVPATSSKLPVVIDLHGSGGNARVQRMGDFLTKSVIIAAQGYANQWNIVKENTKAPDVAFMDELIKKVAEIQQADMDDVTIIGTSNGAGQISRMLIEMKNPRPFKRVIPMVSCMAQRQYHDGSFWMPSNDDNGAETTFDQAVIPDSPGPEIIYFHGTDDKTIPYEGGQSLGLTFTGAQATAYAYAKAFGYTGAQIADNAGVTVQTGITKYEYNGASRVVHYKMQDMSHNAFDPLYSDFVKDFLQTTIEG